MIKLIPPYSVIQFIVQDVLFYWNWNCYSERHKTAIF